MNDLFKINVLFDEKGEELEKIISYFLINRLDDKIKNTFRNKEKAIL